MIKIVYTLTALTKTQTMKRLILQYLCLCPKQYILTALLMVDKHFKPNFIHHLVY